MDFIEFSKRNRLRSESKDGFNHKLSGWTLSDWITATVGEFGEMANIAKKLKRAKDGIPGNSNTEEELKEMLKEEIADIFIYLDLLAQSQGLSLYDIVMDKFNKTSKKIGWKDTYV